MRLFFPAASALWLALALVSTARAEMTTMTLNGDWKVHQVGNTDSIPATVPGCVHTDLLAAKKIPDPFYRDNEKQVYWVGETGWVYRRTFTVDPATLEKSRVLLRCEGLDTLATVKVNGVEVGRADNMFRLWEFDVKAALKAGENEIGITFDSVLPTIAAGQKRQSLHTWGGLLGKGSGWVRKAPYMFGWDWGPALLTCGIWRDISIVAFDARLGDVAIRQDHSRKGKVELAVRASAEGAARAVAVKVAFDGKTVAEAKGDVIDGSVEVPLTVDGPKLWWPNGLGDQPLYEVSVDLLDGGGKVIDRQRRRIGLRTTELQLKTDDHPLRLLVNGVPIFVKGASWIPSDSFPTRATAESLRRYVDDAAAANFNTLRVWGGGIYENPAFYDRCDERGILLWHDFMFSCNCYPAFDALFMANVRAEISDVVKRLRHHPSIAVWCGNNEVGYLVGDAWDDTHIARADYDALFKQLIPEVVNRLDPGAPYVPGSPELGDQHYWGVWHGKLGFETYETIHGFVTEFGMQSFAEPRTVATFTTPADRASVFTDVMKSHQKSTGNELILHYVEDNFRTPKDFESTLWVSQIMQAYGIQWGAEHWRRERPASNGVLYWQYNDCWPGQSWSSVDYFHRWKALHYAARRFYAPLLVSGEADEQEGEVRLSVCSDLMIDSRGTLAWTVTDTNGKQLAEGSEAVEIPKQTSRMAKSVSVADALATVGKGRLMVWSTLTVDGTVASENLTLFVRPKDLALSDPSLKADVAADGDGFAVTLTAGRPALWAWVSLDGIDATYSDNFAHVRPDRPVVIRVTPREKMTVEQVVEKLRVRSLKDTYAPD